MSTTATQGTSIAVLAPYLPHGIEVEVTYADDDIERGRLIELSALFERGVTVTHKEPRNKPSGAVNSRVRPAACLPVLRSFADLCTPLEDGKVPAIEVAKFIYASGDEAITPEEHDDLSAGFGHFMELVVTVGGSGLMCIYSDWLIDTYRNCMVPPLVYDYLRSQHFAVGLESHQYIRKTN